jgi:hypothetical protein
MRHTEGRKNMGKIEEELWEAEVGGEAWLSDNPYKVETS